MLKGLGLRVSGLGCKRTKPVWLEPTAALNLLPPFFVGV